MGKSKAEVKKIHRKKLRYMHEKIKLLEAQKISYEQLPKLAKRILEKRKRFRESSNLSS